VTKEIAELKKTTIGSENPVVLVKASELAVLWVLMGMICVKWRVFSQECTSEGAMDNGRQKIMVWRLPNEVHQR